MPLRRKNWRRVSVWRAWSMGFMGSSLGDRFVQVQNRGGDGVPGGEFVGGDDVVVLLATHFGPESVGLEGVDRWAAARFAEESGDGEGVVADGFGVESEARAAGEQEVLVVAGEHLGRHARRLAVGGGG